MNTNTQEQPQEKTRSIPDIDLTHRLSLSTCENEPYSTTDLCNSINIMVDRAAGVLDCLSELVESNRVNEIPDRTLQSVIQTVLNELKDIDATVTGFHDYTIAEKKKVQP